MRAVDASIRCGGLNAEFELAESIRFVRCKRVLNSIAMGNVYTGIFVDPPACRLARATRRSTDGPDSKSTACSPDHTCGRFGADGRALAQASGAFAGASGLLARLRFPACIAPTGLANRVQPSFPRDGTRRRPVGPAITAVCMRVDGKTVDPCRESWNSRRPAAPLTDLVDA